MIAVLSVVIISNETINVNIKCQIILTYYESHLTLLLKLFVQLNIYPAILAVDINLFCLYMVFNKIDSEQDNEKPG